MIEGQDNVRADVASAAELFAEGAGPKLRIPAYQRPYAWEADDVAVLCRDVLAAKTSGRREYPVGTLVLHENGEWLDVVDGQQRLTTLCLLAGKERGWTLDVESGARGYGKLSEDAAKALLDAVCTKIGKETMDKVQEYLPKCTFVRITVRDVEEAFQLFDTQNGRGKPLTPANLLKAYHFHELERGGIGGRPEVSRERMFELESMWEGIDKGGDVDGSPEQRLRWMDGPLLSHLLGEHLFRLRRWCRGEDAFYTWFGKSRLGEFKGVTLGRGDGVAPCHAEAFLRRFFRRQYGEAGLALAGMPSRMDENVRATAGMDPFVHIAQPIVNGEEFFLYMNTFATIYKMLFGNLAMPGLETFRAFHKAHCLDFDGAWQTGNRYARHVFESLCLLLFDRFGQDGLETHCLLMYRFAYWERSLAERLWYQSAGHEFAPRAVQAMMGHETRAELDEAFAELRAELDRKCAANPGQHLPKAELAIVNGKD
jgi:hypothetical protein